MPNITQKRIFFNLLFLKNRQLRPHEKNYPYLIHIHKIKCDNLYPNIRTEKGTEVIVGWHMIVAKDF
jgi:hypothetical protein